MTEARNKDNRILATQLRAEHAGATRHHRRVLQLILEAQVLALWTNDGHRNLAEWLSAELGISNWEANRWIRAAHALPHLPHVDLAFEEARLSLDKVLELCRFATPDTEQGLVG